ncbi:hypothetical protein MFIFM68171_11203 [Madurella fahalii]|uniref:Uncharacterized protein n=1 Tax=Madurella fahalii TaxID=1157608 RepID=A0ABQ0GTC7_9PEZI
MGVINGFLVSSGILERTKIPVDVFPSRGFYISGLENRDWKWWRQFLILLLPKILVCFMHRRDTNSGIEKILSTTYSPFSLFGLLFTVALGARVIATSYSVEPILAWSHRRAKAKSYAYVEWQTNSTLQPQRLAHQGVGAGS